MVTRTTNTIRPTIAFLEMVPPHVGPTSCSLISLTEIPAAPARLCRSRSPLKVGSGPADVGVTGTLALGETAVVGGLDGVGEAAPLVVGDPVGWGLTEGDVATGVGEGLGVAPSEVRLFVRMLTHPDGQSPPRTISTWESE